jgi:RNA polymerase sigma-70 factor (ECF subfamily)
MSDGSSKGYSRISVTNRYPEHSLREMANNIDRSVASLEVQTWTDEEVVARVLAGDQGLFEILMRRHNQRIYRIVRGILRDDGEAEDVMQDAYVRAYQHLAQFEGRSTFVTWLSRIAMHEAFARSRRLGREVSLDSEPEWSAMSPQAPTSKSPEANAANNELRASLEAAISSLPQKYRSVVILRDVEELTTAEVATSLEISEDLIKVQLHRGRALVRKALFRQSGQAIRELFAFPATRCDRVVAAVLARI